MGHSSRAGGKAWQEECEAAGEVASSGKKPREMDVGAQFTFSFLFSQ